MDPIRKQEIYYPHATNSLANSPFKILPIEVIQDIFALAASNWKSINRACRAFFLLQNDVKIPAYISTTFKMPRVIGLSELKIYKRVYDLFHATPYIHVDHTQRRIYTLAINSFYRHDYRPNTPNYLLEQHINTIRVFIISIQNKGFNSKSPLVLDVRKYLTEALICNERSLNFVPKALIMAAFQMPARSHIMNIHLSDFNTLALWKDEDNHLCTGPFVPMKYANGLRYKGW